MEAVAFDHWVHRLRFTCKVCHLDIGFAMEANATGMTSADIRERRYCGTCHNGEARLGDQLVFSACASPRHDSDACSRCHNGGERAEARRSFEAISAVLPAERFGNRIDWEKAEAQGLIQPSNFIKGLSPKRPERRVNDDFSLSTAEAGIPNITFSHRKHTVWNGCDVCHPDIFIGGKKGSTQYSMQEMFAGQYCGVCHDTVAFPQKDCQRCHTEPVY